MDTPPAASAIRRWRLHIARFAAVLAVGVLVALIAHNAFLAVRNQRELSPWFRPHVSPQNLAQVTARHPRPEVSQRLANFYFMREHMAGATLAVPAWLIVYRWHLERVSRLHVVESVATVVLDPEQAQALREASTEQRQWYYRRGGRPVTQTLYFVLDPAASDYVMAMAPDSETTWFVVPPARLEALTNGGAQ